MIALSAVAAAALAVAGWLLVGASRPAAARVQPAVSLGRELRPLERMLASNPPHVPRVFRVLPRRAIPLPLRPGMPYGATCYVAAGGCSLTPCVEFAAGASGAVVGAPSAVVYRPGIVARLPRRGAPPLNDSACRGRVGEPRLLRVVGP